MGRIPPSSADHSRDAANPPANCGPPAFFSFELSYSRVPKKPRLLLPAPTPPIKVYLPEPKDQTEDPVLIIWGRGFSSEANALSTGAAVKAAVMLAGLRLGVGIDVGTDMLASPSARF